MADRCCCLVVMTDPGSCRFDRSKRLEAVPSCVSDENPMKYPIMTSGEYYHYRATNAKAGSS